MRRAVAYTAACITLAMAFPGWNTVAQEKKDALSRLMKALEEHKEPKREGIAETARSLMLRYGWLRIYVTAEGEIWYVGRRLK